MYILFLLFHFVDKHGIPKYNLHFNNININGHFPPAHEDTALDDPSLDDIRAGEFAPSERSMSLYGTSDRNSPEEFQRLSLHEYDTSVTTHTS